MMKPAPAVRPPRKPMSAYRLKRLLIPWLFLLPGIAATAVFRYYTIFQSFRLSLYHFNVASPPGDYVGFGNYAAIFSDSAYWQAWSNSLIFLGLIILLTFIIPIIQSLLLSETLRGRAFFSTMYILPMVIPATVNIMLWKWIWNPQYGAANFLLSKFGVAPQTFLNDMSQVKFCIIFPGVIGGGMTVLLYLAAIHGVSEDIKEASKIDGCSGFRRMWYITLPNIRFLIVISFIMATMSALQLLDVPFQYTDGGPAGASTTVPLYIYHAYGKNYNYGQGSAAALTLLVVIALITFFQLKLQRSDTN